MNDLSPWRPDDKEWMAARKAEWRHVVANLNVMNSIVDRKAHKYHKEWFFYGRKHPDLTSDDVGVRARIRVIRGVAPDRLYFRLWYHPEPSLDAFREIVAAEQHLYGRREARDFFFVRFSPRHFPVDYGMLGGREELVVKTLFPAMDWRDRLYDGGIGFSPDLIVNICPITTSNLLTGEFLINPYAPGQYLWDHLSYSIQYYEDDLKNDEEQRYDHQMATLNCALRSILEFTPDRNESTSRLPVVKLGKTLRERFEAKDFHPRLMELWEVEKARYEAGVPAPKID